MSFLPHATPAPVPRTQDSKRIALFYAIVLMVFVLTQLFTFESFLELMADFAFPGGTQVAYLMTGVLVACEVFALPFLLRMPLSRGFRWFSMAAGWIVALLWMKVSFWVVFSDLPAENIGFLGTVVDIMPGWWAVFVSLALGILAVWASWGMWPAQKVRKQRK